MLYGRGIGRRLGVSREISDKREIGRKKSAVVARDVM